MSILPRFGDIEGFLPPYPYSTPKLWTFPLDLPSLESKERRL